MTEEEFDTLWTSLVERAHKSGGAPLSEQERLFYAVNLLRGSVPRSGFIGYFEDYSGAEIVAAQEGLRTLGLEGVLALLTEAQKAVLGDKPLPNDSAPIVVLDDSLSPEEYENEADRIDAALAPIEEAFYKHDEEIWNALCEYANKHQLQPKS